MTFGLTKGGNSHNAIIHNVIWKNQKTESFVYHWLCPCATVGVTCLSAFVRASDIISFFLLIH